MRRTVLYSSAAWLIVAALAAMTAGCWAAQTTGSSPPEPAVPATRSALTPTLTSAAANTRVTPTIPPVTPAGPLTLTLWISDDIAPGATSAGRILRNQIDAFTAANPDIHVEVLPKRAFGKGGMLDFLLTTRDIIPARLPDFVALDLSLVPLAAQAGILQPLDGILPTELSGDFFAFASHAARFGDQWIAVPFAADLDHLVYNRTLVRQAPRTWDDLFKQKGSLLLPLAGDNAFLLQYYALGADGIGVPGPAALDVAATAQVLGLFKRAHDLGLVPEAAINIKTGDEAWTGFAAGQSAMAQVSASRFMADRSKVSSALYAPIPTRDGKTTTVAIGWAFGLVTKDSARQSATARFVRWIVQGDRLAPWLRAARLLPTTRGTVPLAVDPPEYASFVREELEGAVPVPPAGSYAAQSEAWRSAIAAVWKGQTTAEEAARTAAGAQ